MIRARWIVKFLVFGLIMLALLGLMTQMLWNWLVPILFAGPVLTFWQALGLLALSKILFWSFGKGGYWRHRYHGHWGQYWGQKWQGMTPEEKEKYRQKMWEKWCPAEKPNTEGDSAVSNV